MKTLCLTFHNGATRTLEVAGYVKARNGVVIMTPGGSIVRFSKEELCRLEVMTAQPEATSRVISFKRAHAGLGKSGTPSAA